MMSRRLGRLFARGAAARQAVATAGALYVGYGAFFLFGVVVNRRLGTEALGVFAFAYAAVQLVLHTVLTGASAVQRREIALAPAQAAALTSEHLAMRVHTLLGGGAAIALVAAVVQPDMAVVFALVTLGKVADGFSELVEGTLHALGRSVGASVYQGGRLLAEFGIAIVALQAGATLAMALVAYVAVAALGGAAALLRFERLVGPLTWHRSTVAPRRVLQEAWPLILAGAIYGGGSRLTQLLVGGTGGREVLGAYNAILAPAFGVGMAGSAIGIVAYPRLCAAWARSFDEFRATSRRLLLLLLGAAVPIGVTLVLAAPLVVALYGTLPAGARTAAMIAGSAVLPMLLQPAYGYALTAMGRDREVLVITSVGLLVSLALFAVLVEAAGLVGAATAFAISQLVFALSPVLWVETRYFRAASRGAGAARVATSPDRVAAEARNG